MAPANAISCCSSLLRCKQLRHLPPLHFCCVSPVPFHTLQLVCSAYPQNAPVGMLSLSISPSLPPCLLCCACSCSKWNVRFVSPLLVASTSTRISVFSLSGHWWCCIPCLAERFRAATLASSGRPSLLRARYLEGGQRASTAWSLIVYVFVLTSVFLLHGPSAAGKECTHWNTRGLKLQTCS